MLPRAEGRRPNAERRTSAFRLPSSAFRLRDRGGEGSAHAGQLRGVAAMRRADRPDGHLALGLTGPILLDLRDVTQQDLRLRVALGHGAHRLVALEPAQQALDGGPRRRVVLVLAEVILEVAVEAAHGGGVAIALPLLQRPPPAQQVERAGEAVAPPTPGCSAL